MKIKETVCNYLKESLVIMECEYCGMEDDIRRRYYAWVESSERIDL